MIIKKFVLLIDIIMMSYLLTKKLNFINYFFTFKEILLLFLYIDYFLKNFAFCLMNFLSKMKKTCINFI